MSFQQRATEAIRASGGRITSQRALLLELLAATSGDTDAERLYRLAREQDPRLSLPTIYRTLHTLETANVITSHYLSSDHERKVYRVTDKDDAFHFTCRGCGRLVAFHSDLISQIKHELRAELGADVITLCMCAGGLCSECREEE